MATTKGRMTVTCEIKQYCLVIFPLAKYVRVGELESVSVLRVTVWSRVGDKVQWFGLAWKDRYQP